MSLQCYTSGGLRFGVRGGMNVTNLMFSTDVFTSSNRTGFYVGPTAKLHLPLGFDIDASLLYNQIETKALMNSGEDVYDYPSLVRKSIALPINLKKGFGLGDNLSIFIFAGPQADLYLSGDQEGTPEYEWKNVSLGVNVGAGVMLLKYLEVRANYCIPCGTVGNFSFDLLGSSKSSQSYSSKSGTWQLGVAVYF